RGDVPADEADTQPAFAEPSFDDAPVFEEPPTFVAEGARHSAHRVAADAELVVGSPLPMISGAYPVALLRRELVEIRDLLSFY
ncbi:hypothetical protein, partial [Pseudacidovorax intermedius]|uniref:hypothetical protein n=1 Tax=Pseudacidovorax intermedius TaxID=433924 RepID=UPI0005BD03DA